jgi:alpha-galactosidase
MRLFHRERVSTLNAIGNTIGRRQLDGRAFLNDPDVFFLREDNIHLTQNQKETVAFVNKHFGSLIFTSDDITTYNERQHELFDATMSLNESRIIKVIPHRNGLIEVYTSRHGKNYLSRINLTGQIVSGVNPYETKTIDRPEDK